MPDEAKDAPRKSWPTTQDHPPRTVPDDFGDDRDATSMTVARAFVPDVRERARRFVPMTRTQAIRVAEERAHAAIVFRCFGADVQRSAVHRRVPRREEV